MMRMTRREEELAARELAHVLNNTRTIYNPLPGYDKNVFHERYQIGLDCDEVYPNIYIGDASSAKNKQYLMKLGISHVVNTAEGKLLGQVDTDQDFYRNTTIQYLGFSIMDLPVSNIGQYFAEVADFMEKAIKGGGKVLVHCLMGMSRSSTCVLAYLMIKEGMTAAEAIKQVRQHRDIRPNDGFLLQLVQLDYKLQAQRLGYSQ
ncbi:dual specificity protein phosphatase 3 [Homalodisca vitripennis]|uniref:Dual specificity protein phosphatase n=1 Tax=Homalodisca liturata TaxID=320908 RepID=A0A1B6HA20_9HEMI|nr:dual specificity protein phosphatase 3 [Homalodisca vitripennis]KAG8338271.1 Dual specificity protein phosphatase 3 [Homalodisca vitripennis]